MRGEKFYNRAAPKLLENLGLEELIATTQDQYVSKALRIIDDQDYSDELRERLEKLDVLGSTFGADDAKYFVKAIRFLMDNHEKLQAEGSREPILIQ